MGALRSSSSESAHRRASALALFMLAAVLLLSGATDAGRAPLSNVLCAPGSKIAACAGQNVTTLQNVTRRATGGGRARKLLQDVLNFQASTPDIDQNGNYASWMEMTSSALLGDVPTLFWGTVPADSVNAACDYIVNTGSYAIPASISGYGMSWSDTATVQAIGGCGASDMSPVGVEAVFSTSDGFQVAVICTDDFTWAFGCSVYTTGDDVAAMYGQMTGSKRRALLQSDGITCGAGTVGAISGGITAGLGCLALGPLAPLCWAAAGTAVVAGSIGSCAGAISNGCFPAHARVMLPGGVEVPISSVRLGQEVAVRRPDGHIAYEPIYLWGHKDATTRAQFVQLDLVPAGDSAAVAPEVADGNSDMVQRLELTPGHFTLVAPAGANGPLKHTRAKDVQVGDLMWSADSTLLTVMAKRQVTAQGLFNPYTPSGDIVVNGVAASCHSEWLLDDAFDTMGLSPSHLPRAYQTLLAPVRALWSAAGPERYVRLYEQLDAQHDLTNMCSAASGASAWGVAGAVGMMMLKGAALTASDVVSGPVA